MHPVLLPYQKWSSVLVYAMDLYTSKSYMRYDYPLQNSFFP